MSTEIFAEALVTLTHHFVYQASFYLTEYLLNKRLTPADRQLNLLLSHAEGDSAKCRIPVIDTCYTFPLGNWTQAIQIMSLCFDLYKMNAAAVRSHMVEYHADYHVGAMSTITEYGLICSAVRSGLQHQQQCRAETAAEALLRTSDAWNVCLDNFGYPIRVSFDLPDEWIGHDVVEQQVAAGKSWDPLVKAEYRIPRRDTCLKEGHATS